MDGENDGWPVPVGPGTAAALVRFGVVAPLLASAATVALARTARARCPRAGGWACWMVVLGMAYGLVAAADAAHCVPPTRLRALRRGVNVAHWLSVDDDGGGGGERSPPWRRGPAPADLRLLRSAGFDHVRLPVSELLLLEEEEEGAGLAAVAAAVRLALDAGLAAVVDLHPTPAFKAAVAGDGALEGLGFRRALASAPVGPLEAVWARLAAALAGLDPERVFLEVMNEPTFADPRAWQAVQGRALAVMRAAAPRHTLVASANMRASAANWDAVDALYELRPYADCNIVYNLHYYEPFLFTHQGATWGNSAVTSRVRGLPYPPRLGTMAEVEVADADAENEPEAFAAAGAVKAAADYLASGFDFPDLMDAATEIAAWDHSFAVPVTVNEIGAFEAADLASRARYLEAVTRALEGRGLGWTLWALNGGFGLYTDHGDWAGEGPRQLQGELLEALVPTPLAWSVRRRVAYGPPGGAERRRSFGSF